MLKKNRLGHLYYCLEICEKVAVKAKKVGKKSEGKGKEKLLLVLFDLESPETLASGSRLACTVFASPEPVHAQPLPRRARRGDRAAHREVDPEPGGSLS